MKITYDPEADAMYIYLKDIKSAKTKEIDQNTIVDYDEKGNVIGIELLFVKERFPSLLKEIQVENLVTGQKQNIDLEALQIAIKSMS